MNRISPAPFFTIVTPTLNIGEYLKDNLSSVEAQSFKNYEHIFIDSFSSDNTLDLLDKYRRNNPDIKVKIFQQPPKGVFVAFNKGIKEARGKYIIFINGDDYFDNNNSLLDAYNILKKHKISWLQGATVIGLKKRKFVLYNYLFKYFFYISVSIKTFYSHQATIMSRDLLNDYRGFNTYKRAGMDPDLFIRLIRDRVPIYFSSKKFGVLRVRRGAVSQTNVTNIMLSNWGEFYRRYKYIPLVSGIINTILKIRLIKSV